jgi:hypothetical protein
MSADRETVQSYANLREARRLAEILRALDSGEGGLTEELRET